MRFRFTATSFQRCESGFYYHLDFTIYTNINGRNFKYNFRITPIYVFYSLFYICDGAAN